MINFIRFKPVVTNTYLSACFFVSRNTFYLQDEKKNKTVISKITQTLKNDDINQASLSEDEKNFLLKYSKINKHNIKLYRLLLKANYNELFSVFKSISKQDQDVVTNIISAAGIVLENNANLDEACKHLDAFRADYEFQADTIDQAKATLKFYCERKEKGRDIPLGYFLRMLNLVLKCALIENKEPEITKLEGSENAFGARFIYELQPWKLKPYIRLNIKQSDNSSQKGVTSQKNKNR